METYSRFNVQDIYCGMLERNPDDGDFMLEAPRGELRPNN